MTTAYSTLMGLALPVQGELSGTWGDTVNNYITGYVDASVAGTQTISGSQTAVTLSKTTASSLSQAGAGSTGSSQYMIINCTGNPASLLTITAPATSKAYIVINATSAGLSGELLPLPAKVFGVGSFAYDMIYAAQPTTFMQFAQRQGASTRDGLGMLVEQAAASFYLWRGVQPDTAPVYDSLRAQS